MDKKLYVFSIRKPTLTDFFIDLYLQTFKQKVCDLNLPYFTDYNQMLSLYHIILTHFYFLKVTRKGKNNNCIIHSFILFSFP